MAFAVVSLTGNPDHRTIWGREVFKFPPTHLSSFPVPNYINPEERGPILYILNSISFAITLVCASLRLYTRIFVRKYFGLDDLFLTLALMGAVGVTTCVILGSHVYYWNRHAYDIPFNAIIPSGQVLFATEILWYFTSNCVRASILSLYYRLINHLGLDKCRWVLHATSVFVLGLFIAQETTVVFGCWPIRAAWTFPPIHGAKCINLGATAMIVGILNTFSEAVIAALPLPIIFSLMISKRHRQVVIGILCGGFFVVIVGSVRLYLLWKMVTTGDPTWWSQPHWICSEFEMDVAIICACAPAILSLISKRLSSRSGTSIKVKPSQPTTTSTEISLQSSKNSRSMFGHTKAKASETELSVDADRPIPAGSQSVDQRAVDIEGIGTSGFGYTVTITTEYGTKVRRRWDIRKREWQYFPEEIASDTEEIIPTSNAGSRVRFSRGSGTRKMSVASSQLRSGKRPVSDAQTEKSFEVRESFQLGKVSGEVDRRYTFKNRMSGKHEDPEAAFDVPEIPSSPRPKRIRDIRLGVLPSPTSVAFDETLRDPAVPKGSTTKPTVSSHPPASTRLPSSTSPATQPLNSSQLWATSPHIWAGAKTSETLRTLPERSDDNEGSSDEEFILPLQRPSPRTSRIGR